MYKLLNSKATWGVLSIIALLGTCLTGPIIIISTGWPNNWIIPLIGIVITGSTITGYCITRWDNNGKRIFEGK